MQKKTLEETYQDILEYELVKEWFDLNGISFSPQFIEAMQFWATAIAGIIGIANIPNLRNVIKKLLEDKIITPNAIKKLSSDQEFINLLKLKRDLDVNKKDVSLQTKRNEVMLQILDKITNIGNFTPDQKNQILAKIREKI
jgi:hypothetical protein